jgi:methionyl aminopeptidase
VIYGIPGSRKLACGDIVSVDIGAYHNGFHGDAARTFAVGEVSDEAKKLIEVTKESFFAGIKFAKRGNFLHEISASIQDYVEDKGFTVVEEYIGHGVGASLHEEPEIPNYRQKNKGPRLMSGMILAIEPMVNIGTHEVETLSDKWTVVTADRKLSAHYENTVLITDGEPEILTI